MRKHVRVWLTTLTLGLTVGGCLPCVPGIQIDSPRTAACLAAADCTEVQTTTPVAPESSGGGVARAR